MEMDLATRVQAAVAGRYKIAGELGKGGMGSVYLAHATTGERVAIKVMKPELAEGNEALRFRKEVTLASQFHHPNIVPLLATGDAEGIPFHITPYVEGGSLRDRLERERQLSLDDALRVLSDVGAALEYAHAQRVIHRDIKPENILLEGDKALLTDLGLAKALDATEGERLTRSGVVLGTAEYLSPEQALDEPDLDERCDVYALGCVFYEMLTGEPPFTGATPRDIMMKHVKQRPRRIRSVRPDVPPWVEAAALRALAKKRGDRFDSVRAFCDAVQMQTPTRSWLLVAGLTLVAVALLALAIWAFAP
jgi:eukaryotic-like serine/threonine-protein kinase